MPLQLRNTLLRRLFIVAILGTFLNLPHILSAQTFVGLGPTYSIPTGDLSNSNQGSLGATAVFGSRRYCDFWLLARLDYDTHQFNIDSIEL